jgi:hypothetical protein
MKLLLKRCMAISLILGNVPASALEPLALYDNFNATNLAPNKWVGGGIGSDVRDVVRQTQPVTSSSRNRRLRLLGRLHGGASSNSGGGGSSISLEFARPAKVTAIKTTVQVKDFAATKCTGNPNAPFAGAHLSGFFFNTSAPTAGSHTNDVFATIRIARRPNNTLRVESLVNRCDDALCAAQTSIDFDTLGTITKGQTTKLQIQWDPDNNRFIFRRDNTRIISTYNASDSASPGSHGKRIELQLFAPNCASGPRPAAFMDTTFDDVFVNASAAP